MRFLPISVMLGILLSVGCICHPEAGSRSMMSNPEYAVLGRIYDAATDPGRWRHALDAVAVLSEARTAALFIRDPVSSRRPLFLMSSRLLEFSRSGWGIYYGLRLHHLQDADWDLMRDEALHDLIPDDRIGGGLDLDRRADFRLLEKRLKIRRRLCARLSVDRAWFDALALSFEASLRDLPPAAAHRTAPLLAHLTKAAEIGRTFRKLKQMYEATLSVLDRVQVGLAIALPSGEIIVQNAEASRILDARDGLSKGPDGRLNVAGETIAALSAAVREAASTARGEAAVPERLMSVARSSGASPLLVDVAPLRDASGELETDLDGALITLIDPDSVSYLRVDRFALLYGLTEAEGAVLSQIVQGMSVAEIAETRGTQPSTAKNQIAAILRKTGVSRRAELIRLVVKVLPPIA